jgi:hypothetical protein
MYDVTSLPAVVCTWMLPVQRIPSTSRTREFITEAYRSCIACRVGIYTHVRIRILVRAPPAVGAPHDQIRR